jgi:hypothetical protein
MATPGIGRSADPRTRPVRAAAGRVTAIGLHRRRRFVEARCAGRARGLVAGTARRDSEADRTAGMKRTNAERSARFDP